MTSELSANDTQTNYRTIAVGLAVLLLLSIYHQLRTRTVKKGLEMSVAWDEGAYEDVSALDTATTALLNDVADRADVPVEDLPKRIETYTERIADLETEADAVRTAWADAWWDARLSGTIDPDEPQIVVAELDLGNEHARELVIGAMERAHVLGIAVGHDDETFAVGVGDSLADRYPADEVAKRIAEATGGTAGGMEQLAMGGGGDDVADTAKAVRDEIGDELSG